jgi:sugar phosphate isomerase/epimerase
MRRRDFLAVSAASLLAAGQDKRERLAVSSYCFHNLFVNTKDGDAPPIQGKPLELLDLPELIADRYHIHNLEVLSPHFASRQPAYLREVNAKLSRTHSRIAVIPVDVDELWDQPGLSSPDEKVRRHALSLLRPWIETAHAVGARAVRCDPGRIDRKNLAPTVASFRELAALAHPLGLGIIVQNYYGVSAEHPEELVRLVHETGDRIGTLPDFGNFPDQATRERGLKLLFPLASTVCHARDTESDGKGGLVHFDLGHCVKIARDAGYKGLYSIESEARGDVYANVQYVCGLLLKNI